MEAVGRQPAEAAERQPARVAGRQPSRVAEREEADERQLPWRWARRRVWQLGWRRQTLKTKINTRGSTRKLLNNREENTKLLTN